MESRVDQCSRSQEKDRDASHDFPALGEGGVVEAVKKLHGTWFRMLNLLYFCRNYGFL